ncbi:MAG: thioredoxin-like protein [Rhodospirillales bacterium]|nr:thioredoxin-like protein [Rhodospirillales bacterium]
MQHAVVSRDEWLKARTAFLAKEKAHTRAADALAEERRALPWIKIDKNYVFDGPNGNVSLSDLFRGRSQLFLQHFMMSPDWTEGCTGCSFMADHIEAARQHFEHHDVAFAAVSRAPITTIEAYRKRMGWGFPWVSSGANDFNFDFHVSFKPDEIASGKVRYNFELIDPPGVEDLPGVSAFYRNEKGEIFHTYSSFGRGNESVLTTYAVLDLMPKGRDETQPNPMGWVKRHDKYENDTSKSCCAVAAE